MYFVGPKFAAKLNHGHCHSFFPFSPPGSRRLFGSRSVNDELSGHNAYEVLGVPESSTFKEIKASFRRLAKENHPDVSPSDGPSASRRFLLILAAYEILSDSQRRVHYDSYLLSQRKQLRMQPQGDRLMYSYHPSVAMTNQIEVVEWLKCYRLVIDDILLRKRFASGSGYLDEIENELYEAIRAAYYGPLIESMDLLPECFEAEERSKHETPEVLHLVSGRDLFGIVNVVNQVPRISHNNCEKLNCFAPVSSEACHKDNCSKIPLDLLSSEDADISKMHLKHSKDHVPDAYSDLELHISGQKVATATRIPPRKFCNKISAVEPHDQIHVFLKVNEEHRQMSNEHYSGYFSPDSFGSMMLLGTIKGLGTSPEEGSCFVYDSSGAKTHVIMKHRTLLVKHMHWFQIGNGVSTCECRCSRARLPSSKFWLFEPRCGMHDIGGWYIETFGRDKNGKTILSQRQWDGNVEHLEKRLHPAMYLMALAYRTLDIEITKGRKRTVRDIVEPKISHILRWCRRLV